MNNAAIDVLEPVLALAPADWSRIIEVNLTGAFQRQHATPELGEYPWSLRLLFGVAAQQLAAALHRGGGLPPSASVLLRAT